VAPVDSAKRMRALREWQRLLDGAFRVPGTSFRFGWDPIIGMVPWAGDLFGALMSCALLMNAHQMRVPRVIQLRMLLNVGIDVVLGIVPVVGDVADFFWKSNTRNLALLERHAGQSRPPTPGDWIFVGAVVAALVLVAAVPIIVMYWILHGLLGRPLI
jgi:Domain of unknown function (DUF4112)